ncbi:hypothetical protein Taro_005627 [Colocasia esculenta]|uniref:Uncharacterized protein n=1 Tax=Colocasia esculenta TaxID=4460 RepID=A0A843TQF3_COLES|nr:hypothetical protein [Colocasia esculenta]
MELKSAEASTQGKRHLFWFGHSK